MNTRVQRTGNRVVPSGGLTKCTCIRMFTERDQMKPHNSYTALLDQYDRGTQPTLHSKDVISLRQHRPFPFIKMSTPRMARALIRAT
eukprot:5339467-Amphidinium_carterae.1